MLWCKKHGEVVNNVDYCSFADTSATCYSCQHTINVFGNQVECKLMQKGLDHVFVDWYYWNHQRPKECPLGGAK